VNDQDRRALAVRILVELRDRDATLCEVARDQSFLPLYLRGRARDIEAMVDALEAVGL
jgi:hypothetical protein